MKKVISNNLELYRKTLTKMRKYERTLIEIASFKEGSEVTSGFDEPNAATKARESLGVRTCNKLIKFYKK